jgi:hypothetical protein
MRQSIGTSAVFGGGKNQLHLIHLRHAPSTTLSRPAEIGHVSHYDSNPI